MALAECCISRQIARETPRLIGADVDLTTVAAVYDRRDSNAVSAGGTSPLQIRLDALLFGESQGRIIISVAASQALKVLGQAKILGVPACQIGRVGGTALQIKTSEGILSGGLRDLHDVWWNAIARAMS